MFDIVNRNEVLFILLFFISFLPDIKLKSSLTLGLENMFWLLEHVYYETVLVHALARM